VARDLRQRLSHVRETLPPGVEVEVVYDRTRLVDDVIDTAKHNLLYGAVLVIAILFFLLGSFRAGIIVALTIPLAMLFAAPAMKWSAIAASLLSLGAIDFGILVDGAVVMTENVMRRTNERQQALNRSLAGHERLQVTSAACREVARPVFFGLAIIALVLVPVLALQGVEGKLFRPMALTLIFALAGALVVALLLTPALSLWMLPRRGRGGVGESRLSERLGALYERLLGRALRRPVLVLAAVAVALAPVAVTALRMGSEFVPRLGEGSIVLNLVRLAGITIDESVAYNTRIEQLLLENFPDEVAKVWSRVGTAEVATDPMGTELTDVFVTLTPRSQWRRARTQDELVAAFDRLLSDLPGQTVAYTQPIEMRANEMVAGIRSDLGVKIYGDDFDSLRRVSDDIQRVLTGTRGAVDVAGEQLTGQPVLRVYVDDDAIARVGVSADRVLEMVDAVGGVPAGEILEGQLRFPLVVRLPDDVRKDPAALGETLVPTASGAILPLDAVTRIVEEEAPATVTREWGRRRTVVQCNVRGRDLGSFVEEARQRIRGEVDVPVGYTLEFGGQFEHLQRANARFRVLVPLTLALVFMLLYASLGRMRDAVIVFTGIPLAAAGGVVALWARGLPFSVSAAVGFIALSGIAVLNGQVLVTTLRRLLGEGFGLRAAASAAGRLRMRAVLATAVTDAAGFLPMALSTGVGAEGQRPLATVVIGGVLTSTMLTLFVLPLLYTVFARPRRDLSGGLPAPAPPC